MFGVTEVLGKWYVTQFDGNEWLPCSEAYPTHGKALIAAGDMAREGMSQAFSARIASISPMTRLPNEVGGRSAMDLTDPDNIP